MGGGGSTTVENNYDDQWIKDWQSDAEGREQGYIGQISDLFGRTDEATRRLNELGSWNQDRMNEIGNLQNWNQDRINEISGLTGDVSGLSTKLSDLETAFGNRTTEVGDVSGLEDIISGLQENYSSVSSDLSDNYLKSSDFETRMSDNLSALSSTLRDDFGKDIEALNLDQVRESIEAAEGDLGTLSKEFSGLSKTFTDQEEWLKQLDLEGFNDRLSEQGANIRSEFQGDLTDLQNILESGRGEALANLENQLGKDRAADILQLKQDIESGRASEIEQLAGSLRQEYGDQLFDLSDTFDERLSGVQSDLGGDISALFSQQGDLRGDLEGGLATLTSGLGTTSQQLEALRDSFGDYQTQAASNLGDVRSALEAEIGDLSGSLTSGLADMQTDYLDRILGTERAGATARDELRSDLTGAINTEAAARESGLATEASAREAGLASAQSERTRLAEEASRGFQDVYKTREQAIADLSGRFGENLRAQEESLGRRIDDTSRAVDEKIGRLGSMMNYRMLGDSAGGVKMRRSKAYKSGAVNTGTGQLSRSMKLKTLNI